MSLPSTPPRRLTIDEEERERQEMMRSYGRNRDPWQDEQSAPLTPELQAAYQLYGRPPDPTVNLGGWQLEARPSSVGSLGEERIEGIAITRISLSWSDAFDIFGKFAAVFLFWQIVTAVVLYVIIRAAS